MVKDIRIQRDLLTRLQEEAQAHAQEECCGFLAGREGVITTILPAPNALASSTEFQIAPRELFRLVREIRARNLEHLGIYHSHPAGDNCPSHRDIERAFYPGVAYFIVSPRADAAPPIRAFSIRDGEVKELAIELSDAPRIS